MKRTLIIIAGLIIFIGCKKDSNENPVNPVPATVTDIDGNVYHTVVIGTQVWLVENLKTTKYNDGTTIPLITENERWNTTSSPAYCWYNNDSISYKNTYGALYNWWTVNTGKLAPKGWHVASDAEWTTLTTYLGGEVVAGGKIKEAGTTHWLSPNYGADNSSGFTALPGGIREDIFKFIGGHGNWWSSSVSTPPFVWSRNLYYLSGLTTRIDTKMGIGFSVRCMKDL